MNSTKHILKLLVLPVMASIGLLSSAHAQENTKDLKLSEAIAAVLANNKNIQLAKLDGNIATVNYKQTDAVFLPQADLSYTTISTNNQINAFDFKLQQGTIIQNDFNPALLNHRSGVPDYMVQLEVKQALLNIDMLYMRKGAEKQTEVYQIKMQRTQEYLSFETTKAYLQLKLVYNAVKVLMGSRYISSSSIMDYPDF